MRSLICICVLSLIVPASRADDIPERYRPAIDKGLKWLVGQQKADGHWEAGSPTYTVTMTSLAGVALMAEGSTPVKGAHAKAIRKAVDWLVEQSAPNGLICGSDRNSTSRCIFEHGHALLFLSCVYEKTDDAALRRRVGGVLNRAVRYSTKAQTTLGGYGYLAARDGNNFSEGAATVVMLHGLRAAKNAGIPVPKEVLDKGLDYLKKSTNNNGGIIYSLSQGRTGVGSGRPALTAGALVAVGPSKFDDEHAKKWFAFCGSRIAVGRGLRIGHHEFTHFYLGQSAYALGDNGYAALFPKQNPKDALGWSAYRKAMFTSWMRLQKDGYFPSTTIGPVYPTACFLTIMQLDKEELPIFSNRVEVTIKKKTGE